VTSVDIGARVKEGREYLGISQKELAGRLGIKAQTVSAWEQGRSNPSHDLMVPIANIFGVSVDCLFDDVPLPTVSNDCQIKFETCDRSRLYFIKLYPHSELLEELRQVCRDPKLYSLKVVLERFELAAEFNQVEETIERERRKSGKT
jgi:transcriptional regulator with XRE-family HTH domain